MNPWKSKIKKFRQPFQRLRGAWGCGCPVDTSAEGRSTDRAGRRDSEPLPDSKGSAFGRLRSKRNKPEKSLGKGWISKQSGGLFWKRSGRPDRHNTILLWLFMVLCIKYSYLGSAGSAPPWERGRPLVAGLKKADCCRKAAKNFYGMLIQIAPIGW